MHEFYTLVKKTMTFISRKDRKKIWRTTQILIFLSFLDIVGIVLLGTVATITFNSVTNDSKPTRLEIFFQGVFPENISRGSLVIILSLGAFFALNAKTLLQGFFLYRFSKFLARLESDLATLLYRKILQAKVSDINVNKYADYQYSLTSGVNQVVVGVIGSVISFSSDLFAMALMLMFAIYASPASTLITFSVFALTFVFFNKQINRRAHDLGILTRESQISLSENVLESFRGIKEIKAYKIENLRLADFEKEKRVVSTVGQMRVWLMGSIRYLLELSILVSGGLVALLLSFTSDLKNAVTVTTIFVVIGFRLIPNIQRLQNSITSLRIAKKTTLPVFEQLEKFEVSALETGNVNSSLTSEFKAIIVKNLSFNFEGDQRRVLTNIDFELMSGQTLVVLGESGSGKTTLVDLLTGLYEPSSGSISYVTTSGDRELPPGILPISYISQNCALFGSDIYQNIALKKSLSASETQRVDKIIESLNLHELRGNSLESRKIRSDNTNVSGGERQRIAIGRAKYFDENIVVLDEPTSALDAKNKSMITKYLNQISKTKTIIIITHDLDLIAIADKVLILEKGKLKYYGSREKYKNETK